MRAPLGSSKPGCSGMTNKLGRIRHRPIYARDHKFLAGMETLSRRGRRGVGSGYFDAAITELKKAGIRFRVEPEETPVCHMAVVFDPDGNAVCIHKRKA